MTMVPSPSGSDHNRLRDTNTTGSRRFPARVGFPCSASMGHWKHGSTRLGGRRRSGWCRPPWPARLSPFPGGGALLAPPVMRNPALEPLDDLIGEWSLTLTNAWFLESLDIEQHGRASARWLGDAFIELEAILEGEPLWPFRVREIGRERRAHGAVSRPEADLPSVPRDVCRGHPDFAATGSGLPSTHQHA